jgi:uncharacterized damage-inducible protein DinB
MKQTLGWMLRHMEWADRAVIDCLRRQAGSEKAVGIMTHIVAAERLWLTRVGAVSTGAVVVWPHLSLDECERQARENARAVQSLLDNADAAGLARTFTYTNSKGERFESRLDDILLHLFLHGSYHRGQIALLQRMDGQEPVYTDYIHYRRTVGAGS